MDWNTIGTILATGIVIVLGYWAQHYWASKRETGDARRKYRESIVTPIKEALTKLGTNLEWSRFMDTAHKVQEEGNLTDTRGLQKLEESMESRKISSMVETLVGTIPLIATIINEDTREFLRSTFLESAVISPSLTKKLKITLHLTDEDIGAKLNLAYRKLEDYVDLAD